MGRNMNLGVGGSRRPVDRRIVDGDGDGVRETSLQQNNFGFHLIAGVPPETGSPLWLLGELFQMSGVFQPLRVGVGVRSGTNTRAGTRTRSMVKVESLPSRAIWAPRCMWHPLAVVVIP